MIRRWLWMFILAVVPLTAVISTARAQCAEARCDDVLCQPECQECQICAECQTPMGMQMCGMAVEPGQDAGLPGNGMDAGAPMPADAGQAADAGAVVGDAAAPQGCMNARCGDAVCAAECGECDACADCANEDALCGRDGAFDFTDCLDGAYYERMGFPEVTDDGGGCSQPDCPTFEAFCAVPAHRGVGVTVCSRGMPCPGGTPMPCDCGDGEVECRDREEVPDECQNDCDCVGSPNGGRCREDEVCGNICSLRCLNRNQLRFENSAFSSCEFPCPTTRVPHVNNPGVVAYRDDLPDYCKGGTRACPNPEATPVVPSGTPQDAHDSCGFYLRLRDCLNDCGACEENRLEGYYAICSNIRTLSNGGRPRGLPAEYFACGGSESFREYADGMMFCLQAKASGYMSEGCRSCNDIVSGMPDIDIESGIIGAHTGCNETNRFCDLARVPGGAPLKCFGASLGRAWGSILGHHSPIGALQPVGLCHLTSQLVACAEGDPLNLFRWQRQICEGYVDGCMSQPNLSSIFPEGEIPGFDTSIREILQRKICEATCPQVPLAALLGIFNLGVDGALAFERRCNALLTQGISIFGFPVFPGLGDLGIPGFGSGRDPCLTY